ncbi:hypothetical protein P154DRAFT_524745, partial [Amniculicola lignicola CBS 123094]
MKTSAATVILCAALAGQALARPSPSEAALARRGFFDFLSEIPFIGGLFKGENNDKLKPVPDDLPQDQLEFLKKTEEYVDMASKIKGERNGMFAGSGLCFQEYPCYSIINPNAAQNGDHEEIDIKTASELVDAIVKEPKIKYTYEAVPNSMFAGYQAEAGDFVFQIQGDVNKEVDSKVVAGLFTNLVQIQFNVNPDEEKSNTIRGAKVVGEGETEFQIVCLYPKGADALAVQSFCLGINPTKVDAPKEEASTTNVPQASQTAQAQNDKRFFDDIFNGLISTFSTFACTIGQVIDDDTCKKS